MANAETDEPPLPHLVALAKLGLEEEAIERFLAGDVVVYSLTTRTEPGIGMIELCGRRLRSGIVDIKTPGEGIMALSTFMSYSKAVADSLGVEEVEIFGAAVINERLANSLRLQGYLQKTVSCPDILGGGDMEVLFKVFLPSEV
jgi:hypothetical protein